MSIHQYPCLCSPECQRETILDEGRSDRESEETRRMEEFGISFWKAREKRADEIFLESIKE